MVLELPSDASLFWFSRSRQRQRTVYGEELLTGVRGLACGSPDDRDIMIIGEMIRLHPELEQVIDYALPDGTGTEDDGTGAGVGVDSDADVEEPSAKRAKAKSVGRAARAETKKLQGKAPKKAVDVQKATQAAMEGVLDKVLPSLQSLAPKPSAARQAMEESEKTSAALALSADLRTTYDDLVTSLAEKKAMPVVDEWYVGMLEKKLGSVRARMEKDADAEL